MRVQTTPQKLNYSFIPVYPQLAKFLPDLDSPTDETDKPVLTSVNNLQTIVISAAHLGMLLSGFVCRRGIGLKKIAISPFFNEALLKSKLHNIIKFPLLLTNSVMQYATLSLLFIPLLHINKFILSKIDNFIKSFNHSK